MLMHAWSTGDIYPHRYIGSKYPQVAKSIENIEQYLPTPHPLSAEKCPTLVSDTFFKGVDEGWDAGR